jgi:hypothetical protein
MSWRISTLGQEAIRNTTGSLTRTVVTILITGAVTAGLAWTEYVTTDSLLDFQARYTAQGGYVVVASNPDGLDTGRCERLGTRPDVLAAGSIRPGTALETNLAPGTLFQTAAATPGLFGVWLPQETPTHADLSQGLVIGAAAADELGLDTGRHLQIEGQPSRPIGVVADTEDRAPESMRWLISVIPATGTTTTCWVEYTPTAYQAGLEMTWAVFSDSGPQLSVNQYRRLDEFSIDPLQALAARPQRQAWTIIGATLAALTWIGAWFRRSELGLYRAIGTTTPELATITWIETILTIGTGTTAGLAWATALRTATNHTPLTPDQLTITTRNLTSALLLALLLAPLATLLLGRGDIATQLKDR